MLGIGQKQLEEARIKKESEESTPRKSNKRSRMQELDD